MRIIDLESEHHGSFFKCLEDWSQQMAEAGDHKQRWFEQVRDRGLRVKLALDDEDRVGGMIQYVPAELAPVEGENLEHILCVWVHGYRQGRGNFQGRGLGRALLAAAEKDARARGLGGMSAWGIALPFWMKASWFRRLGYRKVDRIGIALLLWKPFREQARPPRWIRPHRRPEAVPGRVTVTAFLNGWCPAQNIVHERARRAAATFGESVVFQSIDTSDRATFLEWGISDALFIDGREVKAGPPPPYEKIRRMIERRTRRLGRDRHAGA